MLGTMATPKKTKPKGRPRSVLTETGDRAARDAKRTLLLATLQTNEWNLTAAARALRMTGAPDVIRAIKDLGLENEYEAARKRGDVSPGNRAS